MILSTQNSAFFEYHVIRVLYVYRDRKEAKFPWFHTMSKEIRYCRQRRTKFRRLVANFSRNTYPPSNYARKPAKQNIPVSCLVDLRIDNHTAWLSDPVHLINSCRPPFRLLCFINSNRSIQSQVLYSVSF